MLLELTNRILLITLILAYINVIRHTYYFIQVWFTSTDENPIKYKISSKSLLFLGISVAYILSVFFTGVKL